MIILATLAVLQGSGAVPPATPQEATENTSPVVALSASGDLDTPGSPEREGTERAPMHGAFPTAASRKQFARAPSLVMRNRPVRVEFVRGALLITAEGRALSNGQEGDTVRVMNTSSRSVVLGVVIGADRVAVQ